MQSSGPSQQATASSIQAVLRTMAQGSQRDIGTVTTILTQLFTSIGSAAFMDDTQQAAALLPSLRDLLHAAGWLHHCFAPGSSLRPAGPLPEAAEHMWVTCVSTVNKLWSKRSRGTYAALQSLLEPCRRPQVPGGSCCLLALPSFCSASLACAQQQVGEVRPQCAHWAQPGAAVVEVGTTVPATCTCM
jgi:hypothetical protein